MFVSGSITLAASGAQTPNVSELSLLTLLVVQCQHAQREDKGSPATRLLGFSQCGYDRTVLVTTSSSKKRPLLNWSSVM